MKHIILIGLPGSGKTTVGRLLSQTLHRPFADSDAALEQRLGCSIPKIFARYGEAAFRVQESRTLSELCAQPPQIIATGGGAILRQENRALLRRSGWVIFLDRSPRDIARHLDTSGRPVMQQATIEELSRQRRQLYLACAHASLYAVSPEEAVRRIAALEKEQS